MSQNNKPTILHKPNLMVKAKYNLTALETKLYLNILYFLQAKANDNNFETIGSNNILLSMPKYLFQELIPGKQYLEDAKFIRLFEGLRTKPIYYKLNKKWTLSGFIDRAIIDEDNPKMVNIEIDKFTLSMLSEYKDNGYTPLNLALMFGLEGMYSYRLYELIRLWSNTKELISYTVEELKEYLMLEEKKSYNTYANFKNKVIIPAVDELNMMGLFKIEYFENKIGRKVVSIDFKVKDLDKRKYFEKKDKMEVVKVVEYQNIENNGTIEPFKMEKNSIILSNHKKDVKNEIIDFFMPDETIFTKGTLRSFKKDFEAIDFKNKYMEKAFDDAVMITLDRDDVETIKATSYKFFKGTLDNKIIEYKIEEEEDKKHKEEMNKYW